MSNTISTCPCATVIFTIFWTTFKRQVEDADRKIHVRLHQEAVVLPPRRSAFVVVSSDLDFNTTCGFLAARGFAVAVLHSRQSHRSVARSLAFNASKVFVWEDIVACRTGRTGRKRRNSRGGGTASARA